MVNLLTCLHPMTSVPVYGQIPISLFISSSESPQHNTVLFSIELLPLLLMSLYSLTPSSQEEMLTSPRRQAQCNPTTNAHNYSVLVYPRCPYFLRYVLVQSPGIRM